MAHQMEDICVFSVFCTVEGAFDAASRGITESKDAAPRDALMNGCGRV